jgi:hypothetical protein
MIETFTRFFFSDDIYISYSHRDGTLYASHLAEKLEALGYSCFFDRYIKPGTDLPKLLFQKLRRCRSLVVVGSASAVDSQQVTEEIDTFQRTHGSVPLVVIEFDRSLTEARWAHLVAGRAIDKESVESLRKGVPSRYVIEHIVGSLTFQTRQRRLRALRNYVITSITLLVFVVLALSLRIFRAGPTKDSVIWTVFPWALSVVCLLAGVSIGLLWQFGDTKRRTSEAKRVADETEQAGPAAFLKPFISYSHADKSFAKSLEIALADRGVRCWLDEKNLRYGDDIHEMVASAINDYDKFLLCCSKSSLSSWWVDNELGTAFLKEEALTKKHGRKIWLVVPLNLDGSLFREDWKSGYKAQLLRRKAVDFTKWRNKNSFQDNVESVLEALDSNINAGV